jgi:hypothetical protein
MSIIFFVELKLFDPFIFIIFCIYIGTQYII